MLEEAAQELRGAQTQAAPLLIAAVSIFECDLTVVRVEDALRSQRGVIDIRRQILNGCLATAGWLDIHNPFLTADRGRDAPGLWMIEQCSPEPGAKTCCQSLLGQEEVRRRRLAPAQAVGAQTSGRNDAMYVRMELQAPAPGVQ